MSGYIKLYRSLLDWEWYKNIPVRILFEHCLLRANHKTEKWQGITIGKGSFITSYENLSIETGLSVRQVRTALDKLKMTGELTSKTTSRYSMITIKNWNLYQSNDKQNDNQATSKRQASDKQATTNNNEKNDKNEKKERIYSALSKNSDLMFDENINKVFDFYKKNCPDLVPIKFETRDLELRQAIKDFLIFIDFDFSYFFDLCQKANEQRLLIDNKIDIKSLIKNHTRIYSGFYNAQNSDKPDTEIEMRNKERENRIKELERGLSA